MSPEVADAIGLLEQKGILSPAQAARLLPVARRELVSVRLELKALLYGGVLLAVSGVGLFLKENHDRIGPVAIASLIAAAAAGCLLYVLRRSPPFSWGVSPSTHVAADYVLLLCVSLFGADLAYAERQFRFLGSDWPYHLLVLSLAAVAAAYRFDSRVVLSLALSSFAAWRGLSARFAVESVFAAAQPGRLRANAIACAALFLAAAFVSFRAGRKPHFEPVFAAFGWVLLFGALLSGVFQDREAWPLWVLASCIGAAGVIVFAYRRRRLFDFAVAVVAAYLALLKPLAEALGDAQSTFFIVAVSSVGVLVLLVVAHRRMRAQP